MNEETITQVFYNRVESYAEKVALRAKKNGVWQGITWKEFGEKVKAFGLGLLELGIKERENICLISENRPEWAYSDMGIMSVGAVTIPVYTSSTPDQIGYIIENSNSRRVIVSNKNQLHKLLNMGEYLPCIKDIIVFDHTEETAHHSVKSFETILNLGKQGGSSALFKKRLASINPSDLLTVIYTSGTTGDPKGVMLTHRNLISNCKAMDKVLHIDDTDTYFSFLPLSHVFERMAGYYYMVYKGALIAYPERTDAFLENIVEIRPTLMCGVPRLFEMLHDRVIRSVKKTSTLRRKIFHWALKTGMKRGSNNPNRETKTKLFDLKYIIAKKMVFSKIHNTLGGRLRFFISGGAPLSPEIVRFFCAIGIPILEGYGLSETSPVISCNSLDSLRFGTVGRPIPDVEVKVSDDGEILTKGPHVMKGYFNNPHATSEAIDRDGWFHTGDIGELDKDGYLKITDRKKDIIVTANGKNISPQNIESMLRRSDYIEQACVLGDKRKYLAALIVPDMNTIEEYAESYNITLGSIDNGLKEKEILSLIKREINLVNANLADYEAIKRFTLLKDRFSQATGELTPTLKVKRNVIAKKYEALINSMYR